MAGVVEFLDQLFDSGIRIALATSAGKHRTLHTLEELGLCDYFETIVTGDDVSAGKPDPAIYRLAAARMGEDPADLLAVEDAVAGVKAARSAGLRCAALAHNGRADALRRAGAHPVVEDFHSFSFKEVKALFA